MRHVIPFLSYGMIALGAIIFMALMSWTAQRGGPAAGSGSQSHTFRYKFAIRWFALFAAFGVPIVITALIAAFPPRAGAVWYVMGAYVLFVAIGIPLFWETSRYYVSVGAKGLERRSAWTGLRSIPWDDIGEVTYSPFNAWFVFASESGDKIRIHSLIGGLNHFLQLVEMHLPPAALTKARTGYTRLGRAMPRLGNEPILEARPPR